MTTTTNQFGQPVGFPVADWRPPMLPGNTALQGRFCRLEPLSAERHADALWAAWQQPDPATPATGAAKPAGPIWAVGPSTMRQAAMPGYSSVVMRRTLVS
ncbi:hypothetical protein [Modicisalibacter luteus]|uniref:hypothetical protein n=1 Tax=Modicisalibacter luteus TaxID=453962 RepID=UPI00363A5350